jgi:hypothetical protein
MSAAIALLASCSAEQPEAPSIPQQETDKVYLEVTATQPTTPQTRITYVGDGSTDVANGEGINATWSASETLGVVSYSGTGTVTPNLLSEYLTGGAAGTITTFAGNITDYSTGDKAGLYSFYRPVSGSKSGNTVTYDYTQQTITLTAGVGDPNAMSSLDVLYTEAAAAPAGGITLKRASSIIRFVLKLPEGTPAVNRIELSASSAVFYEKLKLTFNADGTTTATCDDADKAGSISVGVTGDAGTAARTITAYMLLPGVTDLSAVASLKVAAVTGEPGAETLYWCDYDTWFDNNDIQLVAEKTYTFAPSAPLKPNIVWAGSNIYWDGTKLTFDLAGNNDKQYYQGVFFKWGSLVGISPALTSGSNDWSGNVKVYVPTYRGSTATWSAPGTIATDVGYATYTDIPYTSTETPLYNMQSQWGNKMGDICQFLGATNPALRGYRVPQYSEFFRTGSDWWQYSGADGGTTDNALGNAEGTTDLSRKAYSQRNESNTFIPAAGYRLTTGELYEVGRRGNYWSNDGYSSIYFLSNGWTMWGHDRQNALSIRCVKN